MDDMILFDTNVQRLFNQYNVSIFGFPFSSNLEEEGKEQIFLSCLPPEDMAEKEVYDYYYTPLTEDIDSLKYGRAVRIKLNIEDMTDSDPIGVIVSDDENTIATLSRIFPNLTIGKKTENEITNKTVFGQLPADLAIKTFRYIPVRSVYNDGFVCGRDIVNLMDSLKVYDVHVCYSTYVVTAWGEEMNEFAGQRDGGYYQPAGGCVIKTRTDTITAYYSDFSCGGYFTKEHFRIGSLNQNGCWCFDLGTTDDTYNEDSDYIVDMVECMGENLHVDGWELLDVIRNAVASAAYEDDEEDE